MKSPSIEWLHARLDKQIKLVQSYTEIPELDFIIRSCRLKPVEYVFGKKRKNIILYRNWFDEFGNTISIAKKNKIEIIYNDLSLNRNKIISTDLYHGLSIEKIIKISKLVYFTIGKDEDLHDDFCLITFLGIDNHLRTYLHLYDEWQQISPLFIGFKNLKTLANRLDIVYFQKLKVGKNLELPCILGGTWLSCLPTSDDFNKIINNEYKILQPIFGA